MTSGGVDASPLVIFFVMDMKERIVPLLNDALETCRREGLLPEGELPFIEVDLTKDPAHGDYATNVAMVLA